MRVLLIAPDITDISSVPEIRDLTRMHRVAVYNGSVHARDLYEYCRVNEVDVIHIVSHSTNGETENGKPFIQLSDPDFMSPQDLVSLAHSCNAKLLFINTCNSAIFASYSTRRGVPAVIYTTRAIMDDRAWRAPLRFYSTLETMERDKIIDMHKAFVDAIPEDGTYGWNASDKDYQAYVIAPIINSIESLTERIDRMSELIWTLVEKRLNEKRRTDMYMVAAVGAIITLLSVTGDLVLHSIVQALR